MGKDWNAKPLDIDRVLESEDFPYVIGALQARVKKFRLAGMQ